MITRNEVIEFFRRDDFEDNLYTISENTRLEMMFTISQSINERLEELITDAIEKWEYEQQNDLTGE